MTEKGYSVLEIADWFLNKESMTHKKLQKLCYYAEAWSNALYGKSLIIDTNFEAGAHGPVSPKLYPKYKGYGWNDISKLEESKHNIIINDNEIDLLESVWVTYGEKSANELEVLTHQEEPWKLARKRANVSEGDNCKEKIDKDDMKEYYRSIYNGD